MRFYRTVPSNAMIKQTLYFGNPAYLSLSNGQMIWRSPDHPKNTDLPSFLQKDTQKSFNIEDIGFIILDNSRITVTQGLMSALMTSNVILMICDNTHHPNGLALSINDNTLLTERHLKQVAASIPLKKNLWAQIICRKIQNQARALLLANDNTGHYSYLLKMSKTVKSGDSTNREAFAASYYWPRLMPEIDGFVRIREGFPPNNYFNYGYAILRAAMARSIVSTGLIPSIGIFHKSRYNSFCLADDLMEAFRPVVDSEIVKIIRKYGENSELSADIKKELLSIFTMDIRMGKELSPLMTACTRLARSLYNCFEGSSRKLLLPDYV